MMHRGGGQGFKTKAHAHQNLDLATRHPINSLIRDKRESLII